MHEYLKIQDEGHSQKEKLFFFAAMIMFIAAAWLGWVKLRYGFNFIDEGYHMTESWRLAAGDHLFRDGITDTLTLYTVFNAIVFKLNPGITLLGFREAQFCLAILALAFLSFSLYHTSREYWYLPLIFSLFAFTGLDPVGMFSNLNYYTYAHFFLIIHISFFILGFFSISPFRKKIFFLCAGIALFCSSINALYLIVLSASPFIVYLFSKWGKHSPPYDFRELCITLSPFIFLWLIFLATFGKEYVASVYSVSQLTIQNHWSFDGINLEALKHAAVTGIFLSCLFLCFRKLNGIYLIIFSALASVLMCAVIVTSCFGFISPYYNGWFSKPMWFSSLLLCIMAVYWASWLWKAARRDEFSDIGWVCFVIMVPCTMQFLISSMLSTNGALMILNSSIPLTAVSALVMLSLCRREPGAVMKKLAMFPVLLFPFYLTTAWADWEFTYFDVVPQEADAYIHKGFGKGIHTNKDSLKLYNWVSDMASSFSKEDDYIISYVVSPMVYMIAHRKPALDHSFTDFVNRPPEFFTKSIEKMKVCNRKPRLVFVFENFPAVLSMSFVPNDRRHLAPPGTRHVWFGKQFKFSKDSDSISNYVIKNMYFLDKCLITDRFSVMCFADNPIDPAILKLSRAIQQSPGNAGMYKVLGDLYLKKSDYASAIVTYKKSLALDPHSLDTLSRTATAYALAGKNRDSLNTFRKVIEIDPYNADAYYNLACLLLREEKDQDALQALEKAIRFGFGDCNLLRGDKDLARVRNSQRFKEIVQGRCPR